MVAHIVALRVLYDTALPHISEPELRAPLLTCEKVAYKLGNKPDALAKAIRQGGYAPPFSTPLFDSAFFGHLHRKREMCIRVSLQSHPRDNQDRRCQASSNGLMVTSKLSGRT